MSATIQVPHLKANSFIPLLLSLNQVNGLYTIYSYLTDGLTKEEGELLKTKIETKQPLSAKEMSILQISIILQLIHKSGEDNNLIEYHDVNAATVVSNLSS
jgi:hypothetical protein